METLKFMETSTDEMDTATIRAMDESRADRMNIEKVSKELYEVLVVTTEGKRGSWSATSRPRTASRPGTGCTGTTTAGRSRGS